MDDRQGEMFTYREGQAERERLAALGGMMREIIHEVKNRLFAIHSGLQLLRMDLPADPEMADTLNILFEESGKLEAFLKQLRLLCPSIRPRMSGIDPVELIENTAIPPSASEEASPVLKREVEGAFPQFQGERDMVAVMLHALLQNAVDASPPGGVILLSIEHDGPHGAICLVVSDEGPGIPDEHRERLFDPFFSTRGGRTGIGLTVARKIMEDHGGSIRLEGRVDGGTIATAAFPTPGAVNER